MWHPSLLLFHPQSSSLTFDLFFCPSLEKTVIVCNESTSTRLLQICARPRVGSSAKPIRVSELRDSEVHSFRFGIPKAFEFGIWEQKSASGSGSLDPEYETKLQSGRGTDSVALDETESVSRSIPHSDEKQSMPPNRKLAGSL